MGRLSYINPYQQPFSSPLHMQFTRHDDADSATHPVSPRKYRRLASSVRSPGDSFAALPQDSPLPAGTIFVELHVVSHDSHRLNCARPVA